MEYFYDLLGMAPFARAFIEQLISTNSTDLLISYGYVTRYQRSNLTLLPPQREISFVQFVSTLFCQTHKDLIDTFDVFDKLLHSLIDFIDCAPRDQLLHRSMNSLAPSTLLSIPFQYKSMEIAVNHEESLSVRLRVLDCDTIDQVKEKLVHYFNSFESTSHLMSFDQLDLLISTPRPSSYASQMPMVKQWSLDAPVISRKKSHWNDLLERSITNSFAYHLCHPAQVLDEKKSIEERLKENKKSFQEILNHFYREILRGLKVFSVWKKEFAPRDARQCFEDYIQLVSDLLRRLNRLMLCRSTCPIVQSSLNLVADGLEFIFQTKKVVRHSLD